MEIISLHFNPSEDLYNHIAWKAIGDDTFLAHRGQSHSGGIVWYLAETFRTAKPGETLDKSRGDIDTTVQYIGGQDKKWIKLS